MKRGDELPIEPLSDAAWKRVEKAVFDELDQRSQAAPRAARTRRVGALAVGLCAVAAAIAAVWLSRPWGRIEPSSLTSTRIVAERGVTETMLGDVSIQVEPASALVVVESNRASSLIVLERGAASFSVPPREQRPAFAVQAGEVRVEVVGTRFRVERRERAIRVDAYEGTVRVVAGAATTSLRRGQSWSNTELSPKSVPVAPASAPRNEPSTESSLAAATKRERPSGSARARADAELQRQQAELQRQHAQLQRQQFEQAARLEASDPARASRVYGRLANEDGAWAENALYALGRLELELGHRARALRHFQRYLARHPHGENVSDVRALIAELSAQAERSRE